MDKNQLKQMCESHMNRYVEAKMADGTNYDGIVEHVDDHWLVLAVPGTVEPLQGYGWGAYRMTDFDYRTMYPYPRRYARLVLPLAALAELKPLPYYW